MWLLDTHSLKLKPFQGPPDPGSNGGSYAILSHVWSKQGEQSFQELNIVTGASKSTAWRRLSSLGRGRRSTTTLQTDGRISAKIRNCCAFARTMGYRYLWIDSCCIDKTSSAELSEAINSMYQWYARAAVCFAFLEDVGDDQDPAAEGSDFRRSRWFRRGWTLQELIAPQDVLFLSMNWHMLGTKEDLADVIEEITGVDRAVLLFEQSLDSVSVARRMSWASNRDTTRVEDEAYALLGLFGICMPTIYGEGRNAFLRLQEEILRTIPDQTIFVWGSAPGSIMDENEWYNLPSPVILGGGIATFVDLHGRKYGWHGGNKPSVNEFLLADTPRLFSHSSHFSPVPISSLVSRLGLQLHSPQYTLTSYGVRTKLPIITWKGLEGPATMDGHLAVLACQDDQGRIVALILRNTSLDNHQIGIVEGPSHDAGRGVLLHASLQQILAQPTAITVVEVCITHRSTSNIRSGSTDIFHSKTRKGWERSSMFKTPCTIFIPKWILSHLGDAGFVPTSVSDGDLFFVGSPEASACTITFAIPRATLRFSVSLAQCTAPQDKAYFHGAGFLHAALAYWDERETGPAEPTVLADCAAEHVVDWEDAARVWDVPGAGPITLRFKNWPCGESESESAIVQPLFALEVHVPLARGDDQSQSSIS